MAQTSVHSKLNPITLKIQDNDLANLYNERRHAEITRTARFIAISRLFYSLFVFSSLYTESITIHRPAQYFLSSLLNYMMISITDWKPRLQFFLAPVSVITFTSFAINDPDLYLKKSDHLALLTGFVSISYLTSQFLSIHWINTVIG
jgi:hypothetical protein